MAKMFCTAGLILGIGIWLYARQQQKSNHLETKHIQKETDVNMVNLLSPTSWSLMTNAETAQGFVKQPNQFSIVSFNTLRRGYDFTSQPWISVECRQWVFRRRLLQKMLVAFDADIICLQVKHLVYFNVIFVHLKEAELATFTEDFGMFLDALGYDFVHAKARWDNTCYNLSEHYNFTRFC